MAVAAIPIHKARAGCTVCNLREVCLPSGLPRGDVERIEGLIATRRRLVRGERLFRAGDRFEFLYALRFGSLKSSVVSDDGHEQVTGFHMPGDLLGFDGIASESHACDVIALEASEVCVIPYVRLQDMARWLPALRGQLHRMMSREIVREHGVLLLLGTLRAEARLAAFLLGLAQRFAAQGYSRSEFALRMTRAEIGRFLGMKLETVSRLLSRFAHAGLIEVNQRHVRITDAAGLRALVAGDARAAPAAARVPQMKKRLAARRATAAESVAAGG